MKKRFFTKTFVLFLLLTNCWTWHKPVFFPDEVAKNDPWWVILLGRSGETKPAEETVTVTGQVTDANGTALANHTLTFEPKSQTTTTDSTGAYSVSLPVGTYTVTVTDSNGNVVGTYTLTVSSGGGTSIAINSGGLVVTGNGVTGSPGKVATPTFSVASGTYSTDQNIVLTTSTEGAIIYYTTDGTDPTVSSTQYSGAIAVSGNGTSITIKAIAVKSGMTNSAVASGTYTINYETVATPTFSPNAGTYTTDQSVTISTTTSGATIYYTTDGTDPTVSSTQYSGAIAVSGNGTSITIKAIAIKAGMLNSAIANGTWTISYENVDLWNGIVAYYPFNGNAKDESGVNSNNGTIFGTTTAFVTGRVDGAVQFNNAYHSDLFYVNDYISLPTSTLTNTITACHWVKLNYNAQTTGHGASTFFTGSWGGIGSDIYLAFYVSSDRKIFPTFLFQSQTVNNDTFTLDANWHLACLIANSKLDFYMDGALIDSKPIPFSFNLSGYYQDVSMHRWWATRRATRFNGEIDDLRIYNRALNATEVLRLYQNSATAPTPGNSGTITTASVTSTSLTLNWTKASDSSGTGEYATPQNKLQYKVFRSTSDNISTIDTAEANGAVVQNWTTDINSVNVTGLSAGTTYYFNVLVRDEHGNRASYARVMQATVQEVVATPTFSPTPGTYLFANSPIITMSTTTSGATIYYTTDGSTPTTSSTQYATGISLITVAEYLKIRAIAVKSGMTNSAVASGDYYLMAPLLKTGQTTCSSGVNGDGAMGACPQTITGQDGDYQKGQSMSYTDNGNGTITDNRTGLMWQKCSMGQNNDATCSGTATTATWADAITYCDNLVLGGHSDWRLPGIKQLRTLVDFSRVSPSINNIFPATVAYYYWSSSTYVYNASYAWYVYFITGDVDFTNKSLNISVRCVRGL